MTIGVMGEGMSLYQISASGDNEATDSAPDNEAAEMVRESAPSTETNAPAYSSSASYVAATPEPVGILAPYQGTQIDLLA